MSNETEPATTDAAVKPTGNPRRAAENATMQISLCAVVGAIAAILGAILAIGQKPSTSPGMFGGVEHHGSDAAYNLGLALSGVGYLLLMVAVIAWGVILGIRASRD